MDSRCPDPRLVAGGVSAAAHLGEQRLALLDRQVAPVPIRACVLPPVVEEPLVVVLGLERLDFRLMKSSSSAR